MINIKYIFHLVGLFLLLSCTNAKQQNKNIEKTNCLPEYIWISYVGESTKITRFTLIRTCESDTSFLTVYRERWHSFADDNNFFDIYCNDYIADINLFSQIKRFVVLNNTYKEYNLSNINNYSAINIVFADKYDSISYIVNEQDSDYFSKMIDYLKITDDRLKEYLLYYHGIQKCAYNDVWKW